MPTRYLDDAANTALDDVIDYMKKTANVDININIAIVFLYNQWRDSIDTE